MTAVKPRVSIASEWAGYSKTLPESAGPAQFAETKRAFYAGAVALYGAILVNLSPEPEPTPEDIAYMVSIQRELDDYIERIKRGAVA